jgi:hypothetical protein
VTEAEWLAATDPAPMLEFLKGTVSDRKLRLLTVGTCQQIWHIVPKRCRIACGALELYADGLISTGKYQEAWSEADVESRMCAQDPPNATTYAAESVMISSPPTTSSVEYALSTVALAFGCDVAESVIEQDYDSVAESNRLRAASENARLVRCVFANPFRPVAVDPCWLTSDVVALATSIYEEKAFDRVPILADALQDAGCDKEEVLNHCRNENVHVRGCWVVDLLFGKE